MKIKSLAIFLLCIYFSSNAIAVPKPISIGINDSRNDKLAKSLEEALQLNISHSREFAMSSGQPVELQLVIEDVKLKKVANHKQLTYTVIFISQHKTTSVSTGNCWEEHISECAKQILRDTKITIRPNS